MGRPSSYPFDTGRQTSHWHAGGGATSANEKEEEDGGGGEWRALSHEGHVYLAASMGQSLVVRARDSTSQLPLDRLRIFPPTKPSNRSEAARLLVLFERGLHAHPSPGPPSHGHPSAEQSGRGHGGAGGHGAGSHGVAVADREIDLAERVLSELTRQLYLHCAERGTLLSRVAREYASAARSTVSAHAAARIRSAEEEHAVLSQMVERVQVDLEALGASARSLARAAEQVKTTSVLDKFVLSQENDDSRWIKRVVGRLVALGAVAREEALGELLLHDSSPLDETLAVLSHGLARLSCEMRCLLVNARAASIEPEDVLRILTPVLNRAGGWAVLIDRLGHSDEMHRLSQALRRSWEASHDRSASGRYAMDVAVKLSDEARLRVFDAIGANMRGREVQLLRVQLDEAEALTDEAVPDPVLAELEEEEARRAELKRIADSQRQLEERGTQTERLSLSLAKLLSVKEQAQQTASPSASKASGVGADSSAKQQPGSDTAAAPRRLSTHSTTADSEREGPDHPQAPERHSMWVRWTASATASLELMPLPLLIHQIATIYSNRLQVCSRVR
jgi:hypothetical protein